MIVTLCSLNEVLLITIDVSIIIMYHMSTSVCLFVCLLSPWQQLFQMEAIFPLEITIDIIFTICIIHIDICIGIFGKKHDDRNS